jgi:hypothetical protein
MLIQWKPFHRVTAVCKILARSSSEYQPSEPRINLKAEMGFHYQHFQMV